MLRLNRIKRGAPARMDREGFDSMVLTDMPRYRLDGRTRRGLGSRDVRIWVAVPVRNLLRDHGQAKDG